METLTAQEVQALQAILDEAIVKSKEEDDDDPVFHEVDIASVNPFGDSATQSNVYDTLAKANLIECSGSEDERGEVLEFVCITEKGLEALKSAQGVH